MTVNQTDSAGGATQSAEASDTTPGPTAGQGQQGQQNQPSQQGGMTTRGQSTEAQGRAGILIPPVDVIEDAGGITLIADMPGVSRDKLDLRLETNSLTIEGELVLDVPTDMESRYAEIKHQRYQRTFALSRELDGEKAVAELANGVLRVRIPKTQHAQPRKIQINAG